MNLDKLIKNLKIKKIIGKTKGVNIEKISINSREKGKNILYIAQRGQTFDGHSFAGEAVINGAVALVVEEEIPHYKFPQIVVEDARKATAVLASEFYGNPKNKLKIIGVTGTNGKTSTVLFISEILKSAGKKVASIGTLGVCAGSKTYKSSLTTPDPLDFHRMLNDFVCEGIEFVVMEVSAHAIALKKVYGVEFEVGILTNITQDHLDFFQTMDAYAKTKISWIMDKSVKLAVVNSDDKFCQSVLEKRKNLLSVGLKNPADVFAVNIEKSPKETKFVLNLLDNVLKIKTHLLGEFNIYNLMNACLTCLAVGVPLSEILSGVENLSAPAGRFNAVDLKGGKTAVIDFAHTPDGLEKILSSVKDIAKGKVISVFGCGGERDMLKRPIMGRVSEKLADFTIITSDNPRFEKPEEILADIEKGFLGDNYLKIMDRKVAIKTALEMLEDGDVAVICGKGGELYQDINGIKIPYNDFVQVEKFIKSKNAPT